MCGLAGFFNSLDSLNDADVLSSMLQAIINRGPDDEGQWFEAGIALGHRRLSILDLSAAGHQPMLSQCGRYVMVFNGEIYNHHAIRQQLEQQQTLAWRGHSDTEVMLAAIASWGIDAALTAFNGMFAFALWDRQASTLTLARDRFGEKPLYYAVNPSANSGQIIFGSELKSLEKHPQFSKQISRTALAQFFKYKCIPAPLSIYEGTFKLPPAHYLVWSPTQGVIKQTCYWDIQHIAEQGQQHLSQISADATIDQLDALLKDAVALRMEADVPLGAFLSGGIDSSTVVALMQAQSSTPINTFSIGFDIPGYNEAEHAKAVAAHLGTHHTEQYVTGQQALAVVPLLGAMYDEPFADSSQIPTYLVSGIAKQHVTVCLSGDGGDELFGGYSRYLTTPHVWHKLNKIPARKPLAQLIQHLPNSVLKLLLQVLSVALKPVLKTPLTMSKLMYFLPWLSLKNQYALYQLSLQTVKNPAQLVLGLPENQDLLSQTNFDLKDFLHVMMLHDSKTYMPDDILVKVDRASMAVSLEGRVPLLDHRIAEFAWQLPAALKVKQQQGKWLLRQVLYRYVPPALIDRPKMGFGVPLSAWLKGDLKDWASQLLDPQTIQRQGLLNPDLVQHYWEKHQAGEWDYSNELWCVLMLQSWLAERGI